MLICCLTVKDLMLALTATDWSSRPQSLFISWSSTRYVAFVRLITKTPTLASRFSIGVPWKLLWRLLAYTYANMVAEFPENNV
jgi:hypothetical protein